MRNWVPSDPWRGSSECVQQRGSLATSCEMEEEGNARFVGSEAWITGFDQGRLLGAEAPACRAIVTLCR